MESGPEVVVALGGGAARGLAHVGVLRELEKAGVRVRAVAGTSIGALVGGSYAAGKLDAYERDARDLDAGALLKMLDVSVSGGGLLRGRRIIERLREAIGEHAIEDLPLPFVAVATELQTGAEVLLDEGSLLEAMRASMAIPGVFQPVQHGERWLVDGGVSTPVPVRPARALAEGLPCVAVNLNNSDQAFEGEILDAMDASEEERKLSTLEKMFQRMRRHDKNQAPGMLSSVSDAVTHLEYRLTRFQLANDVPELLIEPPVFGIGLFDFHRAAPVIEAGAAATRAALRDGGLDKLRG